MKSNREGAHILQLREMKERFVAQGIDLASNTPEAIGHLIKEVPNSYQLPGTIPDLSV